MLLHNSVNRQPQRIANKQLATRPEANGHHSNQSNIHQSNIRQISIEGSSSTLSTSPRQMAVCGLNHFNITASKALIEQVKQFYTDIVGLELGPRAHLNHDGYWLYAGPMPIVHLSIKDMSVQKLPAIKNRGYFNHISLSCVGLQGAIAKMEATQTPYRLIQLPDVHQIQIFIADPAGTGVELTFFNESLSTQTDIS